MSEVFNFRAITGTPTALGITLDTWDAALTYGQNLRLNTASWGGQHVLITNDDESREIATYEQPDLAI